MLQLAVLTLLAAQLPASLNERCLPDGVATRRMLAVAKDLVVKASVGRPVYECVLPADAAPLPLVATAIATDGGIVFIVSRQFEDTASDAALRGLAGHEVAHYVAKDHANAYWRELTEQQKLDQEVQADAVAVVLMGSDAVRAAIEEYAVLIEAALTELRNKLFTEMDYRRSRLPQPQTGQGPR